MGKGGYLLHLDPETDERLRKAAAAEGVPMSQLLREGLEMRLSAGQQGSASLTAALRLVAETALRLAGEGLPAPAGASSWDVLMDDGSTS
jgi:hypothetical protein